MGKLLVSLCSFWSPCVGRCAGACYGCAGGCNECADLLLLCLWAAQTHAHTNTHQQGLLGVSDQVLVVFFLIGHDGAHESGPWHLSLDVRSVPARDVGGGGDVYVCACV